MERTRRRIPEATVARLPVYLRSLLELAEEKTPTISSERLAEMAGVNAAKVRKDLSYLGSYGTRGVGYDVEYLLFQMSRELGLTHDWPVVIVGIGNLGAALANYGGFGDRGFPVAALVDADASKVGRKVGPLAIRHIDDLPELVEELGIAIGIIATPAGVAQDVADRLTEAGVTSILNFAPAVISVPGDSSLRKVDLALELQVLSFYRQRTALDTAEVAEAAKRSRAGGPEPGGRWSEEWCGPETQRRCRQGSIGSVRQDRSRDGLMPVDHPAYPVNLLVAGKRCLVVGGGRVAAQKVRGLAEAEARVFVVAPRVGDDVRAVPDVTWDERPYRAEDLDGCALVITATDDPAVNRQVFLDAEARGLWVNSADDPLNCTFTLPARVRRGDLLVTVSTSGRSPAVASFVRRWLEEQLGPEFETLLELVAAEREQLQREGRSTEGVDWQKAIDSGMLLELIREGRLAEAKERLQACLSSSSG